MKITRSGVQPSAAGPSDWFTGTVRIDTLLAAPASARAAGVAVQWQGQVGDAEYHVIPAAR